MEGDVEEPLNQKGPNESSGPYELLLQARVEGLRPRELCLEGWGKPSRVGVHSRERGCTVSSGAKQMVSRSIERVMLKSPDFFDGFCKSWYSESD